MTALKIFLFLMFWTVTAAAQDPDSIPRATAPDTVRRVAPRVPTRTPAQIAAARAARQRLDSIAAVRADSMAAAYADSLRAVAEKLIPRFPTDTSLMRGNRFFRFENPVKYGVTIRKWQGKEAFFYSVIGLLLLFAAIRNGFYRYLQDLYGIFFRTTLRQRQIKDQLTQNPLPSLLLNIFFVLTTALFITLVCTYFGLGGQYGFGMLLLYSVLGVSAIYLVKFVALKLLGWVFSLSEATDAYIFIVFTTNKIIGIVLLPFVVVLALASGQLVQAFITLSALVLGGLFIYRYYLSYASIHRQIRLNVFHFFLYLCAFEIAPLLLINKLLFRFLA